jgi:hypothetical protein
MTYPLVHIHQKKKIVLTIAAKIASENEPLSLFSTRRNFARGAEFFFVFSN